MCAVSCRWCKSETTEASLWAESPSIKSKGDSACRVHWSEFSNKPISESLRNRIPWSTVSKAFVKSKNTAPHSLLCSMFNKTSSASKLNYHASFTRVKNRIAYHSINWVKKLKYRRRVINKRAKVSRMYDIPNSSYSTKGITENYIVFSISGDPMLEPETSWNIWSLLWLSQNISSPDFLSLLSLKTFA